MRISTYVQLAIKTEPLATYFKMPWKYHLPCLPLQADTAQATLHLISEASPWLLPRAAGYALTSLARIGSQAYQLAYQKTNRWDKVKIILDMTSTISPLLMVVSRISPSFFIASQIGKTAMELKENIFSLKNVRPLSYGEISDKIIPILSHALYLAAMWRTKSYQIRLASILFQGGVCFYQVYKHWQKNKKLDSLIWGVIGAVRFHSGYQYYQLKTAVGPQFVYKQRHAEKQKHVKHPSLTDGGHEQSRLAGPIVEKYLQEKTGKTHWTYAASTMSRALQTAQGMLKGRHQTIFIDARLRENIHHESKRHQYARHEAAIDDLIDEIADPQDGFIVVDHSTAGKHYAQRVDITKEEMTQHHLKYVEGFLFKRENGQTELLDRFNPKC